MAVLAGPRKAIHALPGWEQSFVNSGSTSSRRFLMCLRGDMSFVGPRPERPFFVAELAKAIPYYAERHWVRPGITGWAQINYPYGASTEDAWRKLTYDLYYVKNRSIFLDCTDIAADCPGDFLESRGKIGARTWIFS